MLKIAITGSNGFVGSHMKFLLHEKKDLYDIVLVEKKDFDDEKILLSKLTGVYAVLHLAGLNRGDEEEIYKTNIGLTEKILNICGLLKNKPKIFFISSTHNTRNTAYGRSKKDSEKMILEWGLNNKIETTSVVSPNIFGEFGIPNYNSFVSTFSYNIIHNNNSEINKDATVNLIYIRDVCKFFVELLSKDSLNEKYYLTGQEVRIIDVYNKLILFKNEYFSGIIPKIESEFDLNLFNTFRSYLYPDFFPKEIEVKSDERGQLFEIIKQKIGGQSFFSTTKIGIIRGNHYHTKKIERFCVVSGEALIKLRKLFTSEIFEYKVSGEIPKYIDIPTYYTHSIKNIGQEPLKTMFWSNEIFDPNNPDTFMELVD